MKVTIERVPFVPQRDTLKKYYDDGKSHLLSCVLDKRLVLVLGTSILKDTKERIFVLGQHGEHFTPVSGLDSWLKEQVEPVSAKVTLDFSS